MIDVVKQSKNLEDIKLSCAIVSYMQIHEITQVAPFAFSLLKKMGSSNYEQILNFERKELILYLGFLKYDTAFDYISKFLSKRFDDDDYPRSLRSRVVQAMFMLKPGKAKEIVINQLKREKSFNVAGVILDNLKSCPEVTIKDIKKIRNVKFQDAVLGEIAQQIFPLKKRKAPTAKPPDLSGVKWKDIITLRRQINMLFSAKILKGNQSSERNELFKSLEWISLHLSEVTSSEDKLNNLLATIHTSISTIRKGLLIPFIPQNVYRKLQKDKHDKPHHLLKTFLEINIPSSGYDCIFNDISNLLMGRSAKAPFHVDSPKFIYFLERMGIEQIPQRNEEIRWKEIGEKVLDLYVNTLTKIKCAFENYSSM